MKNTISREKKLAKLLKQTAKAHHKAFAKTGGKDDKWHEWYAKHMMKNGLKEVIVNENNDM
jgi:hypothetical protein